MQKAKIIILDKDCFDELIVYLESKGGEVVFDDTHDIKMLLDSLGFLSNQKGYSYIFDAIELKLTNNIDGIGMIYKTLSNKYHTSESNIEKSIRYSIDSSENRGNIKLKERIFNNTYNIYNDKLSNSQFLFTLANYIAY